MTDCQGNSNGGSGHGSLVVFLSWYALTRGVRSVRPAPSPLHLGETKPGIALKWRENGQYYAWILARGVRDKTVGKPPTFSRKGLGNWVEKPRQTGSPAVT